MQIQKVETLAFSLPNLPYVVGGDEQEIKARRHGRYFAHRYYRSIYSPNAESLLVKLTTDDGLVGWGETQAGITPEVVGRLVGELLAPVLEGADPFDVAVLRDRMYDLMRERGHDSGFLVDAVSACDIALWDLVGKASGRPVYQMLGGSYHARLPCYVSGVPAADSEEELDKVRAWTEKGFTRFKLSYPPTVRAHVERLTRLREEFGDAIEIMIDAHWAFSRSEAVELGRHLERLGVRWLECPLIPEDAGEHAELARSLDIPHAVGEEFRTRWPFKDRLERRAMDIALPDIGRTGITEGRRIAMLCDSYGVKFATHLGMGLGVYIAATLHLAAASPNLLLVEYQPSQVAICDDYYRPSLAPDAGCFPLPPGPGLGVEPLEEKIRPHEIKWSS